jgi:hypothetical protein
MFKTETPMHILRRECTLETKFHHSDFPGVEVSKTPNVIELSACHEKSPGFSLSFVATKEKNGSYRGEAFYVDKITLGATPLIVRCEIAVSYIRITIPTGKEDSNFASATIPFCMFDQ